MLHYLLYGNPTSNNDARTLNPNYSQIPSTILILKAPIVSPSIGADASCKAATSLTVRATWSSVSPARLRVFRVFGVFCYYYD